MFGAEGFHEFDPDDKESQRLVTKREDGTTDEVEDANSEAWLVSKEAHIAEKLEQFKLMQLKEALENVNEEIDLIMERFGYSDISAEAKEIFRAMREKQIEDFYENHSQELVESIVGDLKVRGESEEDV